jgi:2-polyprenyl-6-methoxyphenol hydroxylase-like FAD-dependent oxidoreductase
VVVLGDAAHTIDPAGGGGLTFSLLETEVLLDFHIGHWLREDDCGHAAIKAFYDDARRVKAVQKYFGRGRYIFALNHDTSAKGRLRRLWFLLQTKLDAHRSSRSASPVQAMGTPWQLPAPYLYEE